MKGWEQSGHLKLRENNPVFDFFFKDTSLPQLVVS